MGAVVGGTGSILGGGKFANGGISGALARIIIDNQSTLGLNELSRKITQFIGKIMALPYTVAGVALGFTGSAYGIGRKIFVNNAPWPQISFKNNAIQFENNPLASADFVLGNTINYAGDEMRWVGNSYTSGPGFQTWEHEVSHTYQYEALGLTFGAEYLRYGHQDSRNPYERSADNYARGAKSWWPW